jgi:DNA-directed RNA polymerase specialized sigma24 family protein
MLRAQPDRTSIFGWLYVVATREALRLCQRDRRDLHLETMLPPGSWDAAIADPSSMDDILEAREALEILAGLPERQCAYLTLLVAGFTYIEIAQLTGGRTYTNVTKHIAKARARVRLARVSNGPAPDGGRTRTTPNVR